MTTNENGAGRPKTREERRAELRRMLNNPATRDEVWVALYAALGLSAGVMPPVGVRVIETILSREFPNG